MIIVNMIIIIIINLIKNGYYLSIIIIIIIIIVAVPVVVTDAIQYIGVDMDPINISCTATGVPAPNISWYKLYDMSDDTDIINDGYEEVTFTPIEVTTLPNGLYQITQTMIINLNVSYTADYYCVANNSLDTIQTEFNITVQCEYIIINNDRRVLALSRVPAVSRAPAMFRVSWQ